MAGKLTIGKKMKKQTSLQKVQAGLAKGATNVYEALKPETSMLHESLYPCYVIALSRLQKLDELQKQADRLDLFNMERAIDKIMPQLGFVPEDNDRLVASFSGGWQMRISLGKILLPL